MHSDYDRDVTPTQYSTYKWADMDEIETLNNPLYYNELTDKRIRQAANTEISNRGYIETNDAELIIHYHIVVEDQSIIRNDPYGEYSPYWKQQSIIQYKEGSIIIDFMDANTNNLVWRGWATAVINRSSDINKELISNSIVKIFKEYPWSAASDTQRTKRSKPYQ